MADVEGFIARWSGGEGGQERANYALFLSELADVLGVPRPDPANASTENNDYVLERAVKEPNGDGTFNHRRIDLYKRGCFVLEAKQSRLKPGSGKEMAPTPNPSGETKVRGRRGADRSWDALMFDAKAQAVNYARCLPTTHGWPPFVLVCDVGHAIEVFADFTGQGKNYAQFPDRQGFRIYLEDLRKEEIRERLRAIWSDPQSLDPSKKSARVTREIAERLAAVSKAAEKHGWPTEDVAMFLMRCLFTMFAEDVELLPKDSFRDLLKKCEADPSKFVPLVGQLWEAMDTGAFAYPIEAQVKRFNGEFFKRRTVLPLEREEIGELRAAAEADWREVEPAIFGTLLEQALDPTDRKRLGAHYTPRAYVERLVVATIVEPLREEWNVALGTTERQRAEGREKEARATLQAFHEKLCKTRVLDPACGTGNFLYVSLELLKRLEGEVLEAIAAIGGQESFGALEGHTVDPHQFLGLELNPRAAAIAELVLWIGYLQWHFRTKGAAPSEPILKAFKNIRQMDAVLTWDGYPLPQVVDGRETYTNPRRPEWPTAEYIVGNPPFIGGKDLRARLGDGYTEALWAAHKHMNDSADFVMYWWDRAAELLTKRGSPLVRFGLVTTNSISQVFQRKVMERHLKAKKPVSLVMAIPDHPWRGNGKDNASVRIAMTVVEAGKRAGVLRAVSREEGLETDAPVLDLVDKPGSINSNLSTGVDVTTAKALVASTGICSPGVKLHGAGFIVTRNEATQLGLGRRPGLEQHIREYRNGRDLLARPRDVMVIDFFGLDIDRIRHDFPEVYQHIKIEVKEKVVIENGVENKIGRDWNNRESYRDNWWIFGEPRAELRPALDDVRRYIGTVETAKHRVFHFLDGMILPDNKLITIALDDGFQLGVLSSRIHLTWAHARRGLLEDRPVYVQNRMLRPLPLPGDRRPAQAAHSRDRRGVGRPSQARARRPSASDADRALQRARAAQGRGGGPADLDAKERRIFDDGLVLILKELHDRLDAAVADAYGWPVDLSDEEILARLVALNKERAKEEARGLVRWLRPDYQIPKFGSAKEQAEQLEATLVAPDAAAAKPAYPTADGEQTAVVMAALMDTPAGLDAAGIAARFRKGRGLEAKIGAVLAALHRMGLAWSDDGKTWRLRRAA